MEDVLGNLLYRQVFHYDGCHSRFWDMFNGTSKEKVTWGDCFSNSERREGSLRIMGWIYLARLGANGSSISKV